MLNEGKFSNSTISIWGPSSSLFGLHHNGSRDKDIFFGVSCCYVPEKFTISSFAIAPIISSIKLVF